MAKKPDTPKLDATVKAESFVGPKYTVPPYEKPYTEFHKHFPLGEIAVIWRRMFIQAKLAWELKRLEILCISRATNCFYYEDEDGKRQSCPWWAVHNFEFEGYPPDEADGEDQLSEDQGRGSLDELEYDDDDAEEFTDI